LTFLNLVMDGFNNLISLW